MEDIFVGRQSIYNNKLEVYAYELLYRASEENRAGVTDQDLATSQTIINAFLEIGIEKITGPHFAFINLNREFLLNENLRQLPKEKVVLEILEHVPATEDVIRSVKALVQAGYTIALDDFVYRGALEPLIDQASIIKIDIQALSKDEIETHFRQLKKRPLTLLAEKVETPEEYEYCKALGFDLYQGFFLSRPKVVKGKRIPANRLVILQLLAKLQNPDVEMRELAQLITQDVSFSYRVLRYINSAYFSVSKKVESIPHALPLLGLKHIRQLVSLLALTKIDDKPTDLLNTAIIRAKMSEQCAAALALPDTDTYFTAGLFSVLDALLDMPMQEVIKGLPLADEVCTALLGQEGKYGTVLKAVIAYEQGDWDKVNLPGLEPGTITDIYLKSLSWADQVLHAVQAHPAD